MHSLCHNHDFVRIDATAEQLSSLSDGSIEILNEIDSLVEIDAFVSPSDAMPEQYVQTRINLLTALREIDRESKNVSVEVHIISAEDNASTTAEKYGVENQNGAEPPLFVQEEGRFMPWQKDLYLGLVFKGNGGNKAFSCSKDYRRVRNQELENGRRAKNKKKLGVFTTDSL